ncbi:MAG: hypothetical protein NWE92_12030 [Candidatus Bathyarchaeota archaeon]|nr:hypothetical protein [Candidatus Bathyarchaeota archaeon]
MEQQPQPTHPHAPQGALAAVSPYKDTHAYATKTHNDSSKQAHHTEDKQKRAPQHTPYPDKHLKPI